jgi:hypothetical protein
MSVANQWWLDKPRLEKYGIHMHYDVTTDNYQFRKEISNAKKSYAVVSLSPVLVEKSNYNVTDLLAYFDDIQRNAPDFRHSGPTNQDLTHPAVKHAWDEFQIIKRLSLGV